MNPIRPVRPSVPFLSNHLFLLLRLGSGFRRFLYRRLGIDGPPTGALAGEIVAALEEWAAWRRFGL